MSIIALSSGIQFAFIQPDQQYQESISESPRSVAGFGVVPKGTILRKTKWGKADT
jgi:hypothetical protein